LVIRFDGAVAFADGFLQGFNIGNLYMAPRILYHSSLLKRARMQRYAGSLDAQHLSKKFLGKLQAVCPLNPLTEEAIGKVAPPLDGRPCKLPIGLPAHRLSAHDEIALIATIDFVAPRF